MKRKIMKMTRLSPRSFLLVSMGLLLLLQMRTSLYIQEYDGHNSFVSDLRIRVSRNLVILGISNPSTNPQDDLDIDGAPTVNTAAGAFIHGNNIKLRDPDHLKEKDDDSSEVDIGSVNNQHLFANSSNKMNQYMKTADINFRQEENIKIIQQNNKVTQRISYDSLTPSDAKLIENALGGNIKVQKSIPSWPNWMNHPTFLGFKPKDHVPVSPKQPKKNIPSSFCLGSFPGGNLGGKDSLRLGVDESPRLVSSASMAGLACMSPRGGQSPTAAGSQPQLTFILTFKDHFTETENCLASVLRYASEADSAEYLVVDDGSESGGSGLHSLVDYMKNLLLLDVRLLRHKQPLGYLQVTPPRQTDS